MRGRGLERRRAPRLLSAVLRERVRHGIAAGLIAAAATAGVLIGFGLARRQPLRPLNAVAHMLAGSRAFYVSGFDAVVTPLALLLHVGSVVLWGVVFAAAGARLRGGRLWAGAALLAAGAFVVDTTLVPARLRPGFETLLSTGELAALYVVLATSLAIGLRWSAPSRVVE